MNAFDLQAELKGLSDQALNCYIDLVSLESDERRIVIDEILDRLVKISGQNPALAGHDLRELTDALWKMESAERYRNP